MSKVQTNLYPCGCVSYGKDAPRYCPTCNKDGAKNKKGRITYQDYEKEVFELIHLQALIETLRQMLTPAVR